MELPAQTGTINPYENNSINFGEEPGETSVTDPEYNIVYEVTSVIDNKNDQTVDDMTNNPAYISRKYNRLFSWARKKQQVDSSSKKLVYKDKSKSFLLMLLLLLLCLLACSLSITALALTKIQMESLTQEVRILRAEVNVTGTATPQTQEADLRIEQLVASVTQLYTNQQEIQLKQSLLQALLDNLTTDANESNKNNNASVSMPTAATTNPTPVNIYQGCYDETTTCTEGGNNYWDQCFTPLQPINREVTIYL